MEKRPRSTLNISSDHPKMELHCGLPKEETIGRGSLSGSVVIEQMAVALNLGKIRLDIRSKFFTVR